MNRAKRTIAAEFTGFLAAVGGLLPAFLFAAFLIVAPPVHAWDLRSVSPALDQDSHAGKTDVAALAEYARQTGIQSVERAASAEPARAASAVAEAARCGRWLIRATAAS